MTAASRDGGSRAERERDVAPDEVRRLTEWREADAREARRHLRNILSVVRSLAGRTADEMETVEEFRILFDGRLAAFARAQSVNVRTGLDLARLIGDELLGFGIGLGEGGVEIDGGPVRLLPRAAGLLALLVHELVDEHAAKGGTGMARIAWIADDDLVIDWSQDVGADAFRPLPYWIGQAIAYKLKGRVSEDRGDGLVRRRIRLPRTCYI